MAQKISLPYLKKIRETELALLVSFQDKDNKLKITEVWIPFSQIEEIHPNRIVISQWFASKAELI